MCEQVKMQMLVTSTTIQARAPFHLRTTKKVLGDAIFRREQRHSSLGTLLLLIHFGLTRHVEKYQLKRSWFYLSLEKHLKLPPRAQFVLMRGLRLCCSVLGCCCWEVLMMMMLAASFTRWKRIGLDLVGTTPAVVTDDGYTTAVCMPYFVFFHTISAISITIWPRL